MGWTSYHASHYKNGNIDRKAEMDNRWTQTEHDGYPQLTVLKSVMKGSTYYAAIEVKRNGEVEKVFGTTALTSVDNKDYYNFSYKDIDETMGPYTNECPISILDLLTPTESEWANEWRKRCRERHARTPLSKLPVGTKIHFKLWNGEGRTLQKMAPAYQYRRNWWYVVGQHASYPARRIPDEYEIVKEV